jgi:AraC family transcriptional regulator
MAAAAGLSRFYFAKAFRSEIGVPPYRYVLGRRLDRANEPLYGSQLPVAEISDAVGFSSQSYFTHAFRDLLGVTPAMYRCEFRRTLA